MSFGIIMPETTIEPSKSTDQNVADVPIGETISRQDAIEVGNKIVEELSISSIAWDALKCWAKELFDALPSADRPRSEWIDREIPCDPYPPIFFVECSRCGYRVGRETFLENTFNYCPSCGADMRGERNE